MNSQKAVIVFVVENKMGGVAYFNKNIIDNVGNFQNNLIRVVFINQIDSNHERFKEEFNADEVIHFNYSSKENKYFILKRLIKVIGNEPGAIICNDGLEMEALTLYPSQKTVFQIIHDFYNLKLSVKYKSVVDVFISHTRLFRDVLFSSDPENVKSFYLPHGVYIPSFSGKSNSSKLKIIFVGRLVESKGVLRLFEINTILEKTGLQVEWTIIGRGPLKGKLQEQWQNKTNVTFTSPDTNIAVQKIMMQNDIFILPTVFEGSPVTILEALSCGLVPIVSDLPGGIKEIINTDIGFRIAIGDNYAFADSILKLDRNKCELRNMQLNCRKLAEQNFNISVTANNYFQIFSNYSELYKQKKILPVQIGFRLDHPWLPNIFVKFLRNSKWRK